MFVQESDDHSYTWLYIQQQFLKK